MRNFSFNLIESLEANQLISFYKRNTVHTGAIIVNVTHNKVMYDGFQCFLANLEI